MYKRQTGHGEIDYGNAIGSVICNAALIAAITIAVRPGKVDPKSLRAVSYTHLLCVYAACMIAHQFPKHVMVAGILAFIGLNIVETQLDKLLGTNDVRCV